MNIIEVGGIKGFVDENGVAQLHLETIARGLGFTQRKSGFEYVRWERVNGYLEELGFSPLVGKEFIPENTFYRLSMKADNETGRKFQAWIADEVLPTIRKHGAYMTPETIEKTILNPDFIINLATKLKEEQTARAEAELVVESQKRQLKEQEAPLAIYSLAIAGHNTLSMQEVAKSLNTGRTRLYSLLREKKIIMPNSTLPYQRFIEAGYFKVVERPRASGDTIHNDPATRVTARGFDYIARIVTAKEA